MRTFYTSREKFLRIAHFHWIPAFAGMTIFFKFCLSMSPYSQKGTKQWI